MSHDDKPNTNGSAATSAHGPSIVPAGQTWTADGSEAEFLSRQADATSRAIADTLAAMKDSIHEAGDLKAWMKRYPWPTVGVAAGAGLILAAAFATRRRKANEPESALLEKIVTDEQIAQRLRELVAEDDSEPSQPGVTRSIVASLLQTFGPAVQSAVTAAVAAKASAIFATQEAQEQAAQANHDGPPPATD